MDNSLVSTKSNSSESESFLLPSQTSKKRRYLKWKYFDVRIKLLVVICFLTTLSNIFFFFSTFDFKKNSIEQSQSISIKNYTSYISPISFLNASFMFNSINSFLKQKDSDIFPVGVSYVPALIPKDTIVYHGGNGIPDGFEWVAMDVEFSMNFAARSSAVRRGLAQVEYQKHLKLKPKDEEKFGPRKEIDFCSISEDHQPFDIKKTRPGKKNEPPTLMSFRLKHDLDKLIYLDGASASKATKTGEMDTQVLLYNQIKKHFPGFKDSPEKFMVERDYAEKICKWGKPLGIQGYIRLELGFEFVLCDFHEHLEMVSNVTITPTNKFFELPELVEISKAAGWPINCTDGNLINADLTAEQKQILDLENLRYKQLLSLDTMDGWEWLKAGHKHNQGEKKIGLDYRYLVSAINKTELDTDNYKWRIIKDDKGSEKLEEDIFAELSQYYSNIKQFKPTEGTNWQLKTEGIVQKFTPFLKSIEQTLNNVEMDVASKALSINQILNPLIRRYSDNYPMKYERDEIINTGVWEYTYPTHELKTDADNLIFSSLVTVTKEIFVHLIDLHDLALEVSNKFLQNGKINKTDNYDLLFQKRQESTTELIKTLNWINFGYECSLKCGIGEICFTPSWGPSPLGWISIIERDNKYSQKQGKLPIGFVKDEVNGFTRLDNEQVCLGLDYLIDDRIEFDF
ncbi:hypothetical protein DAHU10_036220 [Hanseniaspora uvarum]|nr:hypothetical protein DAHU10_036220 [Hanseniaspora uvarum]